jgi:hypothetical protein
MSTTFLSKVLLQLGHLGVMSHQNASQKLENSLLKVMMYNTTGKNVAMIKKLVNLLLAQTSKVMLTSNSEGRVQSLL